jgi:spore germination protein YaaH
LRENRLPTIIKLMNVEFPDGRRLNTVSVAQIFKKNAVYVRAVFSPTTVLSAEKPKPDGKFATRLLVFFLAVMFQVFGCKAAPPPLAAGEAQIIDAAAMEEVPASKEYPDVGEESNYAVDGNVPANMLESIEESEIASYAVMELPKDMANLPSSSFEEVWAYLGSGDEKYLNTRYAISDVVHFAAEIDRYGRLADIPRRKSITRFRGRVHLAIVCNSAGLTHFVIQSGSEARKQIVSEILAAVKDYDGLNIDMENVPARDAEHFLSFLSELRAGLGGKVLSVCVPGRTRAGGTYNYASIANLADRVFVMAYDEHWSGSQPGPVASMNWCRTVADYSLHAIGQKKLIMGIPFYGRSWGDKSTSLALIHSTTERRKQEYGVQNFRRVNGIPTFTYDVTVKVTVYYEDEYSLSTRMQMYRGQGVQKIGFWRLGQEPPGVWQLIKVDPPNSN